MQFQAHQVIVSHVERRHEMRHDGDGNEENGGVRDRGLGGVGFWSLGGWEGEDGGYCHVSRTRTEVQRKKYEVYCLKYCQSIRL